MAVLRAERRRRITKTERETLTAKQDVREEKALDARVREEDEGRRESGEGTEESDRSAALH